MEENAQSSGTMTKKTMMEYFELFSKEGFEKAISTYFAEDAVFENSIAMEASGKENIINLLKFTHRGNVVRETLTPVRILMDGNDVAVELVMEVEATEDVADHHLSPLKKGEKMKFRLGVFYKVEADKIARVKVYPAAAFTPTQHP
jgi:limonene-1,2-epoxide hydrolase